MKTIILSTNYQGQQLSCYWNSLTKSIEFNAASKSIKIFTGYGFISRIKTAKLDTNLMVEVHFRKLAKEKIAIIMLKIQGVILKAQAIEISTGGKIAMSSIKYQQLID
ncbi:hypothetical protein [uncultured Shewanella sp.]|uniref:hypothetical protein n=1 Tax=Shewanella frigidimarina TaxID=56812 RepID=UPI003703E14E